MKKFNLKLVNIASGSKIGGVVGNLKTFIVPIVTVIVLIFVVFLVGPRISAILELSKSVKSLELRSQTLQEKLNTLVSQDAGTLKAKVQQAEKALPSQKDVPGLLFSVDKLAADSKVTVTSIQLTPGEITATTSASSTLNKLPLKLTVAGGYESVKGFLSQAISTNRILKVLKAGLTAGLEASISAALEVESYYLPLEGIRFNVSEPVSKLTNEEEGALERAAKQPDFSQLPVERPPTGGRPNPFERF